MIYFLYVYTSKCVYIKSQETNLWGNIRPVEVILSKNVSQVAYLFLYICTQSHRTDDLVFHHHHYYYLFFMFTFFWALYCALFLCTHRATDLIWELRESFSFLFFYLFAFIFYTSLVSRYTLLEFIWLYVLWKKINNLNIFRYNIK